MMKNILSIIILLFLLGGCNNNEDELQPSRSFTSWIEIKDEPGELNQLRYKLYKEYGIPVFFNDTIGTEIRGEDAYGNPIVYHEVLRPGYNITSSEADVTFRYCNDEATMIDAMKFMMEFVVPRLSKDEHYRPYTYFFCDTVYTYREARALGIPSYLDKAANTTTVGIMNLPYMSDVDRKMWGGRILANAVVTKFLEVYEIELDDFYNITNEGETSSPYGKSVRNGTGPFIPPARYPALYELGFVDCGIVYLYLTFAYIYNPKAPEDVEDYLAVCYALTRDEVEAKFGASDKVMRKYDIMAELLIRFKSEVLGQE